MSCLVKSAIYSSAIKRIRQIVRCVRSDDIGKRQQIISLRADRMGYNANATVNMAIHQANSEIFHRSYICSIQWFDLYS